MRRNSAQAPARPPEYASSASDTMPGANVPTRNNGPRMLESHEGVDARCARTADAAPHETHASEKASTKNVASDAARRSVASRCGALMVATCHAHTRVRRLTAARRASPDATPAPQSRPTRKAAQAERSYMMNDSLPTTEGTPRRES